MPFLMYDPLPQCLQQSPLPPLLLARGHQRGSRRYLSDVKCLPFAPRILDRGQFLDQRLEHGFSSVGKGRALAGQPPRIEALISCVTPGVLCLYLMGLNLSNRQIAQELDLAEADVQAMAEQLRLGLTAKLPPARLEGAVEIDEVYVVAGHKGQPGAVAKRGAPADAGA